MYPKSSRTLLDTFSDIETRFITVLFPLGVLSTMPTWSILWQVNDTHPLSVPPGTHYSCLAKELHTRSKPSDSNPRSLTLRSNALTTQPCAPQNVTQILMKTNEIHGGNQILFTSPALAISLPKLKQIAST